MTKIMSNEMFSFAIALWMQRETAREYLIAKAYELIAQTQVQTDIFRRKTLHATR